MASGNNEKLSKDGIVLSLYDFSGVMVRPWAEDGFTCFIVDIQHKKGCHPHATLPNTYTWGVDILKWLPPKEQYRIAFSFSPCDDTAVSGSRWFVQKGLGALAASIEMFGRGIDILTWTGAPWMAEHPVSTISSHFRKPDRVFHPWHYAVRTQEDDNYTKCTHIWHSHDFVWPRPCTSTKRVDTTRIAGLHISPERKNIRSKTPDGFARAVWMANTGRMLPVKRGWPV